MRRNLAGSVIEHGAVRTTAVKAKEVRPFVERLITIARRNTLQARRRVIALLWDRAMADKEDPDTLAEKSLVQKLFDEVAPRYAQRPGGYTRIIHLPERRIGDGGKQVVLQLVEEAAAAGGASGPTISARRKRAARRAEAARTAAQAQPAQEHLPAPSQQPGADQAKPEVAESGAAQPAPAAEPPKGDQTVGPGG
jgi:large subunit ribosomal protein L17